MSKRKWHHPEVSPEDQGTRSWRSAGELEDSPLFRAHLEREFPEGAAELTEEEREMSRRSFTKLMGASSALAGLSLAACRRPERYVVPFRESPEWMVPGKPLFYATAMPRPGGAVPLVVTSYDGRPTKLEPAEGHPDAGGVDAFTQASVLDLYSPSRSRDVLRKGRKATRAEFDKALAALAGNAAAKVAVVTGRDDSPTRSRLLGELKKKFPAAKAYAYEPLSPSDPSGVQAVADYAQADRVLSLGSDFLSLDSVHGPVRPFFDRRQGGSADGKGYENGGIDKDKMNRLYIVETGYSLTGGMADHRLRAAPSRVALVAKEIAKALGVPADAIKGELTAGEKTALCGDAANFDSWVKACAEDLRQSGAKSLVLAGSQQPEAVRALALAINQKLGSVGAGKPLRLLQTTSKGLGSIEDLVKDLNAGAIDTVVFTTPADPLYDAPAGLAEALGKAALTVHHGLRANATALACDWHLPAAHYLEGWGDACSASGAYTALQPMILPLYGGVTELEFLSALLGPKGRFAQAAETVGGSGLAAVRQTFQALAQGDPEKAWKELLRNGFAEGTAYPEAAAPAAAPEPYDAGQAPAAQGLEVALTAAASVWDGRYADNAWLQETPDPVTKLTWDNAALMSPRTAKDLGIYDELVRLESWRAAVPVNGEAGGAHGLVLKIKAGDKEIEAPVLIAFGHADHCVSLAIGYGQKDAGLVGKDIGFNAFALRPARGWSLSGATVESTGKKHPLALTQEHHSMYGRALAREVSTAEVAGERRLRRPGRRRQEAGHGLPRPRKHLPLQAQGIRLAHRGHPGRLPREPRLRPRPPVGHGH